MTWVDVHCHYEDERFDEDRERVVSSLGCVAVDAGCSVEGSLRAQALALKYPHVFFCAGIHPESAAEFSEKNLKLITKLWDDPKCVGAGEIGLDYHWAENPPKEVQRAAFAAQVRAAQAAGLPPVIHTRDCTGDMIALLRELDVREGVMHCFSESREVAREWLDRGLSFSFGGVCTFKNARKTTEVLTYLPRDRVLLETDSPYLSPEPVRGTRNDSRNLRYVIAFLSKLWNESEERVAEQTTENALRVFPKLKLDL